MLPPETWNWNLGTLEPPQSHGPAVEPGTSARGPGGEYGFICNRMCCIHTAQNQARYTIVPHRK
eukprot:scaffold31336_cov69-Phaeocystis_antarctica.AAC.1